MSRRTLVATHLSSVFTSSSHLTHAVPAARRDVPVQTLGNFPEHHDGHASHASTFHSQATGHVLIRTVQAGLAVELISLSTSTPPVRFVFPATIVPAPSIVVCRGSELHLLVVTSIGALFRLILPLHVGGQLWNDAYAKDWCREWQIKKLGGSQVKHIHVLHPKSIAVALSNGSCLRLTSDYSEDTSDHETWNETECRTSSWETLTLLFHANSSRPTEIVAFASFPSPTDETDYYTVSRDRVLRRWSVINTCQTECNLHGGVGAFTDSEASLSLLDAIPQKLVHIYRSSHIPAAAAVNVDNGPFHLVVFSPTPTSASSGGFFRVLDAKTLEEKYSFATSLNSVHCRLQDFVVHSDVLFALWEKQGQSILESIPMGYSGLEGIWDTMIYGQTYELPQSVMDELLLQPGCLAEQFLQAILRPGVFSAFTLRSALQEYKEHYSSLPGDPPPQLLSVYATLGEEIAAVVGCTVELSHDPYTGIAQTQQYWNALRRDWEGFLARCREIERSARWPLCLGCGEDKGPVEVIERERIGQCVEEDGPLFWCRVLSIGAPVEPVYDLLSISWTLRQKLDAPLARTIENEALNILSQEIAFPLADIIIEASNKVYARAVEDDSLETWLYSRLQSIPSMDRAIRLVLDIIGGFDDTVKQEEEEVELMIQSSPSPEWIKALVVSYMSSTIEARYELCLAAVMLLFFIGNDLMNYDPALLLEVFATFRSVVMLRFLSRQTTGDPDGARPISQDQASTDDVISRMSSLHMSKGGKNSLPTYSLLHELLSQSGHPASIKAAAHHFLDRNELMLADTPAHATKAEVLLCERLRLLGCREASRQLIAWLPRSPAVCYVLARLWIDGGRAEEAVSLLQGVAGSFGSGSSLTPIDHDALSAVLSPGLMYSSEYDFYLHAAELFRATNITLFEITFLKLALDVVPDGEDTSHVWASITKGYADLGYYEDSYSYLLASPYEHLKQQYVSQLVYKMCEDEALDRLLSMNFRGLVKDVESALSFKARNADPRGRIRYAQILYTWYTYRGDYRNAALAMYLRARKLSDLSGDPNTVVELAEQQAEALVVAVNALALLDDKNAWIIVPLPSGGAQPRKRRKLRNYIPDDKLISGQRDAEVVSIGDIRQEYAHLIARIELWRRDPSLLRSGDLAYSPWVTVAKLTQAGLYDLAMTTAKALAVDMTELFQRLALQCVRLSSTVDASMMELTAADWLLTDKVSSWPGAPAERGWRYLRQSLSLYDSSEADCKYTKAVLETLLSHDPSSPPPPWLIQGVQEHHPEHLVRLCLKYGLLEEALDHALSFVRNNTAAWDRVSSIRPTITWLPYTLIDAVLKSTAENVTPPAETKRQTLQSEISSRIARVRKHSGRLH